MTRRSEIAFAGAGAGALLLGVTWLLALHVGVFERADQSILAGFVDLHAHRGVDRLASTIAHLCNPNPYVFLAAVPVLVAVVRRRARALLAIGAILIGANLTTQMLKPLLAQPRADGLIHGLASVDPASWPSGHATAAMSLALCCVLAVPPRLRPAVACLGAAFAVAVSYSFLTLAWHYPSDVFGGYLVAGTWTMLAIAVVFRTDVRRARPASEGAAPSARLSISDALAPQAALVAGTVLLVGLVALARPHPVIAYARAHEAFVVGAGAIGLLALAVASAITLAMRR
jgi:membrane-associated phospholipid phosphatase